MSEKIYIISPYDEGVKNGQVVRSFSKRTGMADADFHAVAVSVTTVIPIERIAATVDTYVRDYSVPFFRHGQIKRGVALEITIPPNGRIVYSGKTPRDTDTGSALDYLWATYRYGNTIEYGLAWRYAYWASLSPYDQETRDFCWWDIRVSLHPNSEKSTA